MTGPANDSQPASLNCHTCGRTVWRGGRTEGGQVTDLPVTDGQGMLTDFADTSCPQGGVGCPNTTAGRQEAQDNRPVTARELRKVSDLLAVVDARTRPRP